jgi:serine/threonine-protein kinase RsbW
VELSSREFLSDLQQLAEIRAFVRQTCQRAWQADAPDEAVDMLELAVTEAVANIILHAYDKASDQPIEITVAAEPEQVCVSLFHSGRDFDRDSVPPPAFDGRKETGYGLYLIKQAVDDVSYFRDERGRCGIRLVKKRANLDAA